VGHEMPARQGGGVPAPAVPVPVFEFAIPSDIPAPLPEWEVPPPPDSDASFDDSVWDGIAAADTGPMSGDAVVEAEEAWFAAAPEPAASDDASLALAPEGEGKDGDFDTRWNSVRDA